MEKLLDAWAKGGGQQLPEPDQSPTEPGQAQSSKPSAALQQPSQQQRRRGCSKARQVTKFQDTDDQFCPMLSEDPQQHNPALRYL